MNNLPKFFRHACVLMLLVAPGLEAQTPDTTTTVPQTAMDSAFARARQMVISGQAVAGRQIADSILAATPAASPAYGNALYGQAQLAPTAVDAERIYQRIIVEYPLSAHAGDALLQLAQMERSQGDRAAAVDHLQRYLSENPTNPKRARTGFWLAQLLFEQNDDVVACGVLHTAQAAANPGDVELQNQMNFYSERCDAAVARATADSVARVDSVRADSTARATAEAAKRTAESTKAHTRAPASAAKTPVTSETTKTTKTTRTTKSTEAASSGDYAVQIGAYANADEAQRAVDRLHARGIEARVDGKQKPFRVWIGRYATRAAATKALAEFKKVGIDGFVTSTSGR